MNKVIAMGKAKGKQEAGGWEFFQKVSNVLSAWIVSFQARHWETYTRDEKIHFLSSEFISESHFYQFGFYKFLVKACADLSLDVRMRAVNALSGAGCLLDPKKDEEMLKEILRFDNYIDPKKVQIYPRHLRLLFDICNKLEDSEKKNALRDLLLKIEKPTIEDLPFLIKQMKSSLKLIIDIFEKHNKSLSQLGCGNDEEIKEAFNLINLVDRIAMLAKWIGRMGVAGKSAIPVLFEVVSFNKMYLLEYDIFLKTLKSIHPRTVAEKRYFRSIVYDYNFDFDPTIRKAVLDCLDSWDKQNSADNLDNSNQKSEDR